MTASAVGRQRDLQSHAFNRISQHTSFDSLSSREPITGVIDVTSVSVLSRLVVLCTGETTTVVLVSDKGIVVMGFGLRPDCSVGEVIKGGDEFREALDEGTQWG